MAVREPVPVRIMPRAARGTPGVHSQAILFDRMILGLLDRTIKVRPYILRQRPAVNPILRHAVIEDLGSEIDNHGLNALKAQAIADTSHDLSGLHHERSVLASLASGVVKTLKQITHDEHAVSKATVRMRVQ
jgi:hypothetical protein